MYEMEEVAEETSSACCKETPWTRFMTVRWRGKWHG